MWVAAIGLVVQTAALVVVAGYDLFSLDRDRLGMGLASAGFFVLLAAVLGFCAYALTQVRPGARGPALLAQLMFLAFAWNLRTSEPLLAAPIAIVAVAVIVGMLLPDSVARLEQARKP